MNAPVVVPTSDDVESRSLPVGLRDVAVIAGTFLLWGTVMYAAARVAGWDPWATNSWGRWDTGHYLSIADSGYVYERCVGVANRGPEDWCGNSGWFPGYPYLMRAVSWLGLELDTAGRLIALVAMVGAWVALWFGFLRRRPFAAGAAGMALAAVFPAGVYYGAIFPISTMLLAALLALICLDRQRWLLAGLFGAVAATVYTSGFVVGVIALVPLATPALGDVRTRVRAAAAVGAPVAVGYLLVLLNFQRDAGAWNAGLNTQASYNFEPALPLVTIYRQAQTMGNDALPGAIGLQTLLIAALVVTSLVVAYRDRADLSIGERGVAVLVLALWILPLTLGGDLSLYRAESLLLPAVILLSRLRAPIVAAIVALCAPVSFQMAKLFFDMTLI